MIDQFSQHLRYRGLSPATIRRRRDSLGQLARYLHPMRLDQATTEVLEQFLSTKRAARTRHAYRSDMRTFYAWAVTHGQMKSNPALGLASIKVGKALPRPIDPREARGMLLHGSRQVRRMVALMMFAGLRAGEVARLEGADLWTHTSPPVVVVRNGKGGKDRSIAMHPELLELVADVRGTGPVFPGPAGAPIRSDSVSRAVQRQMRLTGIDGTPHQLRHTFGTEFARMAGGDLLRTAEVMGHESTDTTRGYTKLARPASDEVIRLMYSVSDVA